jgi:transposase
MADTTIIEWLRVKYEAMESTLNERSRRRWLAVEAASLGRGGISAVASATGVSRNTIRAGLAELANADSASDRVRRPGGGRRRLINEQPDLMSALEALVEPSTRGDPQSPLRWTCKSVRQLAAELQRQRYVISPRSVADLLREAGYSLQGNRKTREGGQHPDRNAQFEFINASVKSFQKRGQPVISIDTKKKELVGDFKNAGREWRPAGQPLEVRVHDFIDKKLGKAIPYGVYDVTNNEGWVSVGIDHDTAQFAAQAVRRWWKRMGRKRFPDATELLITADGGGSNSCRSRLWKVALQDLADQTRLKLVVRHLPPGTSKWNKIEHRMFCHITQNWRGQPLVSHEVIVSLISQTTTAQGLKVHAELDTTSYQTGRTVSTKEFADLNLTRHPFHGEWNYTLTPNH